jgi:hypothetical protein
MRFFYVIFLVAFVSCTSRESTKNYLFSDVTKQSGINFSNDLTFTERLNPYTYRNFYNGAGVAIGDINNDGLQDIYFAGNQVGNKMYLNKGNFQFEDITDKAGIACKGVWSSGVTFVDINADGLQDIYVCKSGDPDAPHRYNELFINNGDLTFSEKSKEYGLDITGLSVQASFFDYDKDGDLDCYLLTNSFKTIGNYDLVKDQRAIPDPTGGGNKFFVNDNGKFKDFSEGAHIYRSNIGFGLGITLGDFNKDGWMDLFISNDFFERDYLYINDQHGAFTESLTEYFQSISMGSMGADFADLDNDSNPELFVTEMLPDSLNRKKTKTVFENWNKYQMNVENGYYHQFSRNVLQKKTEGGGYVEIGRLAGVAATEWSWGALLFDMDNDGLRDIFVANGIYKDLLDRDYLTYSGAEENVRRMIREEKDVITKLVNQMPSSKFPNYAFRNLDSLRFENASLEWGLAEPMFSSGSAYGDLDNDGDLDLVVNNLNASSVLYRNNTDTLTQKSISIVLTSKKTANRNAVGAEVTVYCGKKTFYGDNFVTRGFQSSVQPYLTFGLGKSIKLVDSVVVKWPDSGYSVRYNLGVNKIHHIEKDTVSAKRPKTDSKNLKLELVSKDLFRHLGSTLIDFNRDRLLPMMYSNETPSLQKGDVNGDGIEEIYVGGGRNQAGTFIKFNGKKFETSVPKEVEKYGLAEETKGCLADVDNDGDLDFLMATGGRFFPRASSTLTNRIFFNDGKGNFTESAETLPVSDPISTSVTKQLDFDKDGDLDFVIAERFDPFTYGMRGGFFLFQNEGKGIFKDVTDKSSADFRTSGMITDIVVTDFDADGWTDFVVVGDWMPLMMMKNENSRFRNVSSELGLNDTQGWWHVVTSNDLNNDGRSDFVLGNQGLNTFFQKNDRMYVGDFDGNGSIEQIFCSKINDKYYPIADKDELLSQMPSLKKQLLYYKDYGKKSIEDLFSNEVLSKVKMFEVKTLASVLILSSDSIYTVSNLPLEAQFSPIYALLIEDLDKDGIKDLIAGGNQYQVKPQFGRDDASNGWFFKGKLSGNKFSFEKGIDLGVKGQIRDIKSLDIKGTKYLFFAKHNDNLEVYKIRQ